jgi:flagellar biosynthesis/type III secretory pathway chaperone
MKLLDDAIDLLEQEKDILIADDVKGLIEITQKKERVFNLVDNALKNRRFTPAEKKEVLFLLEKVKKLNERNMHLLSVAKSLNEYTLKICGIPMLEGKPVKNFSFEAKI